MSLQRKIELFVAQSTDFHLSFYRSEGKDIRICSLLSGADPGFFKKGGVGRGNGKLTWEAYKAKHKCIVFFGRKGWGGFGLWLGFREKWHLD